MKHQVLNNFPAERLNADPFSLCIYYAMHSSQAPVVFGKETCSHHHRFFNILNHGVLFPIFILCFKPNPPGTAKKLNVLTNQSIWFQLNSQQCLAVTVYFFEVWTKKAFLLTSLPGKWAVKETWCLGALKH
ncbi:hypothetical protein ATANTOWER_031392 [Ataeniobius toweri]|uniref:Uncharacterized protein n=1 Tax=Ataeniobius toweri TaxID=208326 RepID=A0ABU7BJA3_9TELE|nr:hypothetical protein [Ataeniobius toweri]